VPKKSDRIEHRLEGVEYELNAATKRLADVAVILSSYDQKAIVVSRQINAFGTDTTGLRHQVNLLDQRLLRMEEAIATIAERLPQPKPKIKDRARRARKAA
jgi:hypothetical protein